LCTKTWPEFTHQLQPIAPTDNSTPLNVFKEQERKKNQFGSRFKNKNYPTIQKEPFQNSFCRTTKSITHISLSTSYQNN
jgi:hypothetical protein